MKRRFFLFAAPAIVAAPSLMKVSTAALVTEPPELLKPWLVDRYVSDFGTIHVQAKQFTEALLKKAIKECWDAGGTPSALVPDPYGHARAWLIDEERTLWGPV